MKFNVGDTVTIISWEKRCSLIQTHGDSYFCSGFVNSMKPYCGKTYKIGKIQGDNIYPVDENNHEIAYSWNANMFVQSTTPSLLLML